MNKYLKHVLKNLCNRVGADFKKIDFKKENWFKEYTWTREEEEKFEKWIVKYLSNNKKARENLMKFPTKDKKDLITFSKIFTLYCGWKYKNKKGEKNNG